MSMTQVVQEGGLSNPHHRSVFYPISPDNAQPVGMPPAPPSATASGGPQRQRILRQIEIVSIVPANPGEHGARRIWAPRERRYRQAVLGVGCGRGLDAGHIGFE